MAAAPAAQGMPGFQNAAGAPVTPAAASAGFKVTPRLLAIAGVVLAIVAGAYLYTNMNSNSGGITFSPSKLSCSTPVAFTTTAHLPASLHASDSITIWFDGKSTATSTVSQSGGGITQQPDGSWVTTSTTSPADMASLCSAGGSAGGFNVLTPGTHMMQIMDPSGKVLAQGTYTVTP